MPLPFLRPLLLLPLRPRLLLLLPLLLPLLRLPRVQPLPLQLLRVLRRMSSTLMLRKLLLIAMLQRQLPLQSQQRQLLRPRPLQLPRLLLQTLRGRTRSRAPGGASSRGPPPPCSGSADLLSYSAAASNQAPENQPSFQSHSPPLGSGFCFL